MPLQPLDISSDDDDEPSASNGKPKHLDSLKRPKTEIEVINSAKKVVTEGNLSPFQCSNKGLRFLISLLMQIY